MNEPTQQVEIQLGHLCNNRCVFCVSGLLSEQKQANKVPFEPVRVELERARLSGAQRVTFLGGEPTIQRSFFDALKTAKTLGFEEIVIFTNGVLTPLPKFIDRVLSLGDFTWRFSLQGGTPQHHDAVTKVPGSFSRIIAGIENLSRKKQKITANACITSQNYLSLPDYASLIRRYPLSQLHLDMVRPSDAGPRDDEYLMGIMPRYSDIRGPLRELLENTHDDFDINVGNLPYCVLPEWAHRIHHDGELTFTVAADGRGMLEPAWNKYEAKRVDKTHPPQCSDCALKPRCGGVFLKYQQFYGVTEFAPLSSTQLLKLPRGEHHWGWLVQQHLRNLSMRLDPTAKLFGLDVDEHRAVARLRLGLGGMAKFPLDVILTPQGRMLAPHAATEFVDLQVIYAPAIADSTAQKLVYELVDLLRFSADENHSVDFEAMTRWNQQRRRMDRAISALRTSASSGSWTTVDSEQHDEGVSIQLVTNVGPVHLRLGHATAQGSGLQVTYDVNPSIATDFQRLVLQKAVQIIRTV